MVRAVPHIGPIIENVVDETKGKAVLVRSYRREPRSQAFRVQSIPAVYAPKDGRSSGS